MPFSPGDFGTFKLSGFLVINPFSVKSKVVLLDKWDISGKTEFYEKVPFSPGESGTFNLSGFLMINRFSDKSKVVLLSKWHISDKTEFCKKVPFLLGESGTFKLSDFLGINRFSIKSKLLYSLNSTFLVKQTMKKCHSHRANPTPSFKLFLV